MGLSSKQVSSDVQDWNQGLLQSANTNSGSSMELPKPPMKRQQQQSLQQSGEQLKCPRCDSTNTKFCYYNNYNKSQPRHFCKACKRHWTKGGMLRNVPVGGGRKNKRLKTSANTNSPATTTTTTITTTKTATSANILTTTFGGKSSYAGMGAQAPQQRLYLPLKFDDEKPMRQALNQAILGPQSLLQDSIFNTTMDFCIEKNSSNTSNINGLFGDSSTLSLPQNYDLQFPYPSFSSFDDDLPTSISASCSISNLYCQNSGESSALEDNVMTGVDASLSCSSLNDRPWTSTESTSNWGWDDIDKFVTSDVTIPWDDAEIN